MIDLYAELVGILTAFDRAKLEYALCGAIALAVYGAPRATRDIDLLADPAHAEEVRTAVRSCGFTLEALPMTFSSGVKIQRFSKIVEGSPVMLDVLWVVDPLRPIWEAREKVSWQHGEICVVSRAGLITMKLTAGRAQDLADIQRLMEKESGDDERT